MNNFSRRIIKISFVCITLFSLAMIGKFLYKVYEYKVGHWLPGYFLNLLHRESWEEQVQGKKHLIVVLADHHEPGSGEKGIDVSRNWCAKYSDLMHDVYDHYGNRFRYTWFYPIDHDNRGVVSELCKLTREGFGEIEVHWHNNNVDDDIFRQNLSQGLEMLKSFGSFGLDKKGDRRFAYIAGNWNLDQGKFPDFNGVSRQIEILQSLGCYADLTFSTVLSDAQPIKINSLYYAIDDDRPKSYDTGPDAEVGKKSDGLLMLQGPSGFNFNYRYFEWGALESWLGIDFHRFTSMLEDSPTVIGRPDVRFMKFHTHGIQSSDLVLSSNFKNFFNKIYEYCEDNNIILHYCSSREAFNIIEAIEDGVPGEIEDFREYQISAPSNVVHFNKNNQ
jgi:hypothetical protein